MIFLVSHNCHSRESNDISFHRLLLCLTPSATFSSAEFSFCLTYKQEITFNMKKHIDNFRLENFSSRSKNALEVFHRSCLYCPTESSLRNPGIKHTLTFSFRISFARISATSAKRRIFFCSLFYFFFEFCSLFRDRFDEIFRFVE